MKIPFNYTIKNFRERKLTTFITIAGIALVVFVWTAVLMMANGVQQTMIATGESDNVKIIRKSSNGEISSMIDGESQSIIQSLPHLARGADGSLLNSDEPVTVINMNTPDGGFANIMIRGVSSNVTNLRPQVRITEGRWFNPALNELIVGVSIASRYAEAELGKKIEISGQEWEVVGIFDSGGSGFDSEVWGDAVQILAAFNRGNTVSSMTLKLDAAENYPQFQEMFAADKRLEHFEPKIEQEYFGEQSQGLATFINIVGLITTVIFSIGAMVGAMITMYSTVANRTTEIGTLRALGFRRTSIMIAFLFESIIIALAGAVIGVLLAFTLQFFSISTMNFQSFSEITFAFSINPGIIMSSFIFAITMGILGGFLPSAQAARLKIVDALRAE